MFEIISNVAIFSDLKNDQKALSLLEKCMQYKNFSAGHVLTKQGSVEDEFYVLVSGQVVVSKKTPDGDSYNVTILNGDCYPSIGEGGLIEGEVRSATVECQSVVQCLVLTRSDFNNFCNLYPQYALPILKKIAQMLIGRLNQTSNDLMLLHKALMDEIRSS